MTYTYAELEVSAGAYDEIRAKLEQAGHSVYPGTEALDMTGIALVRGPEQQPVLAVNQYPTWWSIEEDPNRTILPRGSRVLVDGQPIEGVRAFNAETGYVRATCRGGRPGHPEEKHVDQETDTVCEVVLRGRVTVELP